MIRQKQLMFLTIFSLMLFEIACAPTTYLIPSADPDRNIFKHPSGVFSIAVPKDWGEPIPFRYDPNVFTFKPSRTCEFTISMSKNRNLPPELPMETVKYMFPEEIPVSAPVRDKGDGWNSIRQDFEKNINGTTWRWFAKFYGYGSNAVAITLNDTKDSIDQYRLVFDLVTDSIVFDR